MSDNTEPNLDDLFADRTVIGAEDFASFFDVDIRDVRQSAADAGAEMLGRSYVITRDVAEEILEDFDFDDDGSDEEDEEANEEDFEEED